MSFWKDLFRGKEPKTTYVGDRADGSAQQQNGNNYHNERYFFYNARHDSSDPTDPKPTRVVDSPDARLVQAEKNDQVLEAVKEGQLNRVKWLLGQGAEVNCVNHSDYTPLAIAVAYRQISFVKFLIRAGADLYWESNSGLTLLHLVTGGVISASQPDLFAAKATESTTSLLAMLVEAGADVDARDHDGETALHRVLTADMAQVLISAGTDVNCCNKVGDTPLHCTSSVDIAECLILAGADRSARNNTTQIPLDRWHLAREFDGTNRHTLRMIALLEKHR